MKIHLDFETRSACDLRKAGAFRYAMDPTTELLCLAYNAAGTSVFSWKRGQKYPEALLDAVASGATVVAHNAMFELAVWTYHCAPKLGWPKLSPWQMDCTMARAQIMALPSSLDDVCKILHVPQQKSMAGHALMMRMCKPRNPRKDEDPTKLYWYEDPEDLERLVAYCAQDVRAEMALDQALPPMTASERDIYHTDLVVNTRGFRLDTALMRKAEAFRQEAQRRVDAELADITRGKVAQATKVIAIKDWISARGIEVSSLAKGEIQDLIDAAKAKDDLLVGRVLELRRTGAKATSLAKYKAGLTCAGPDERARGMFNYSKASTGRWAGSLYNCVTGDHEVLTPDGWRPIAGSLGAARIMCWDSRTNTMDWADASINSYGVQATLSVRGAVVRGSFTPNHRQPVKQGRTVRDVTIGEAQSRELRNLVQAAPVATEDGPLSDAALRFLVALQADGHVRKVDGYVTFHFKKCRKVVRIEQILRDLQCVYSKYDYSDGTQIHIRRDDVPGWAVKPFGNYILSLSARQCALMLDEIVEWDGFAHPKNGAIQVQYADKAQAEWVCTMAALAGRSATLATYPDPRAALGLRHKVYVRTSLTTSITPTQVTEGPTEEVFCPTVASGYWLCRADGRIYITGNCHNLERVDPDSEDPKIIEQMTLILTRARSPGDAVDWAELVGLDPMRALGKCTRAMICAPGGWEFIGADYSNIEGRGSAWLGNEVWKVKAFRDYDAGIGPDLYKLAYSKSFGEPVESIGKGRKRQIGKVQELALGYQGAVGAFMTMGANYGIDADGLLAAVRPVADPQLWSATEKKFARSPHYGLDLEHWTAFRYVVDSWRLGHPNIVAGWWEIQDAVIAAVDSPGEILTILGGKVRVTCTRNRAYLYIYLPSGRALAYFMPRLKAVVDEHTGRDRLQAVIQGKNSKGRWGDVYLYGGLLWENVVQALCRDLLAGALLACERAGYPVVLHVHDEVVVEVPKGAGRVEEVQQLMTQVPPWAQGIPINSSAWRDERYVK